MNPSPLYISMTGIWRNDAGDCRLEAGVPWITGFQPVQSGAGLLAFFAITQSGAIF
ncbi:MAG: hypothetical protein U5L09_14955 [Bacteroidales bacterium]|nr:hypothetical protein [Bacteroidales bacterium]